MISFSSFGRERAESAIDDISPEARGVLDQIGAAVQTAGSSGVLAANLNSILAQMPTLSEPETEAVNAVASVSQSSYEYWEVNTAPLAQQVTSAHGDCLAQYSDEATALQNCMGINGPPVLPTRFRNVGRSHDIMFVANVGPRICHSPSAGDIGEADFVGAGMGAIAGIFGSAPGILAGALVGGLGTSALTGWYRVGRLVYCLARGGSMDPQETN